MTVMATEKTDVVGIRFQKLGKLYHFMVNDNEDIEAGDHVIVETKRGQQLGQVIAYVPSDQAHRQKGMRYVERKANPRDLVMKQVWETKELDALISCREAASKLKINDAKFVKAEYSFDGSWITFHYTTENKNLDINPLKQSLGKSLRTRIEMRLIGPRDVAKIMGGFGACGAPRCCSTFLTEFSPISIRMAKSQGVSLSPQEITGMCGRLRCCLVFEYEQYVEAKKTLPKVGKVIGTPYGEGKVRDVRVLRDSVVVVIDGEWKEVFRHEFEPLDELKALQDKAAAGCSKHEGGGCDCGRKSAPDLVIDEVPAETSSLIDDQVEPTSEQASSETKPEKGRNRRSRRGNRRSNKRN
ncbi:MAG: stage 0 sporulation protein [Anaerolineae bacterium]|nr:stage 0 sporulation protein [Anaerolineae bacterium]